LLTIKAKAEKQNEQFPGLFDIEKVRNAKTIGEIDDFYVAKLFGFVDKWDYYAQCGSKWYLPKIRIPAVAINAIDDPFIESTSLPTIQNVGDAPVRLIYHQYGGHCGFWASKMSSQSNTPVPSHGWIAEELARALDFIRAESKAMM
jgi:predicted alpha/beta-fold hydrolase